ncbi:MAG TPA: hypothetical protein PKH24_20970 [Sedimentisphaerales bacterium]|jgi:hypothetical protein|nr:hypothetical protein [Sedimentisphaerales bacterium]HNU31656.1 hypothetical protein [Sedimentisphaerales bacterium]
MKQSQEHSEGSAPPDSWEEARQYGIDMSALEVNLGLSVLQRIRNHDRAWATADMLRRAMARHHEQH